jgi:hypothetical protein
MTMRNKMINWVATAWLALGMTSTGIVQLIHLDEEVVKMHMWSKNYLKLYYY